MKIHLFIITLLCNFNTLAGKEISPLLKCLIQEEAQIHRLKRNDPGVELNKNLISSMASVTKLFIKQRHLNKICKNDNNITPSLKLIEVILVHGRNAFYSTSDDTIYKGFQSNFLEDLERNSAKHFINYLAGLQATASSARCLENQIPTLKKVHDRYKILEEDLKPEKLFQASEVPEVMNSLRRLPEIYAECSRTRDRELAKLQKESEQFEIVEE